MQAVLVAALASCAEGYRQRRVRDFLLGLSYDELQFIAEFLGASILESEERQQRSRAQFARQITAYQQARAGWAREPSPDADHKMILLLEFLCRSGLPQVPAAMRSSHA